MRNAIRIIAIRCLAGTISANRCITDIHHGT
jgi:hypothetical protein